MADRRRNILFITTDQQRYDALGCNGGQVARTPVVDALAAAGIRYERAHCQNTTCMPARSTILTGQYSRTHGVRANGIPLPEDAPSIATVLAEAGYRTALIGKAHFEPMNDRELRWQENRLAALGQHGPYRGFEFVNFAGHTGFGMNHYSRWLKANSPESRLGFARMFDASPSGETGAPETAYNEIPRDLYHTDWIAESVMAWLDSLPGEDPWFCWMSFPDPHHPWDPPASERHRVDWRDLELPAGHPRSVENARKVLSQKPEHWLAWYDGRVPNVDGAPVNFVPAQMTDDQFREINALIHIENELIDEACGRVIDRVRSRGWGENTDIIYTTDHGELQGDFGLLYKGPFHVDAVMRLPLVWLPAASAGHTPAVITQPVGQVDLAPTFCQIAGVEVPEWMEGEFLPTADDGSRERVLTEWYSQFTSGFKMQSIYRDGWLCTAYLGDVAPDEGLPPNEMYGLLGMTPPAPIRYAGTEGELYNLIEDPLQQVNLWDDPAYRAMRSDLIDDMFASLPEGRPDPLRVETFG
ncbi:sulfatase [Nocardioides daejeonensis]|uniref:sulfatase family protein n=1 Tax=Nocardioides daejeonensis TaxID=1046556 RepID=UPI000D74A8D8|nr:sulfatase-like hydrolase/transferase [Nocardioides daejeonensis]